MSTSQEPRVRISITKFSIITSAVGLLLIVGLGILSESTNVSYELSSRQDVIQLPPLNLDLRAIGLFTGFLVLGLGCLGMIMPRAKKLRVFSIGLTSLASILALLAWLSNGKSVPITFIFATALALSVPIILGAMGGIMSERSGITNIAIEGQLLTGAFMAAVVSSLTDNYLLGVISAMFTASLLSMILALFAIKYLAQQIVVGVVLNVLVIGITNFLYQQWLTEDADNVNFPGTLEVIKIPVLSDIPVLGPIFFENRATVFSALIIVPLLWFVLFKTKIGLRARAVGENPLAADTVGVSVSRTQFWWVTLGGAVAGLGGASLTIGGGGAFGREMSVGLGFIALAVVILGKWNPINAALGALLFGFAIILRIWINQVNPGAPTDFVSLVPYVVTIIAVTGFIGKSKPPRALAIPYVKG